MCSQKTSYTSNFTTPSQEEIRRQYDYDPATGELRFATTATSRNVVPGALAGRTADGRGSHAVIHGKRVPLARIAWVYMNGAIPPGMDVKITTSVGRNGGYSIFRIDNLALAPIEEVRAHHKTAGRNPNYKHGGTAKRNPLNTVRPAGARHGKEEIAACDTMATFDELLRGVRR